MRTGGRIAAALALLAAPTPAPAQVPAPATPPSWVSDCPGETCGARLVSATGLQSLVLQRTGGGSLSIGMLTPQAIADRDRSITLRVDGKVLAVLKPGGGYQALVRPDLFHVTDPGVLARLQAALPQAKQIRVEYLDMLGAPHDADFALDGLGALLPGLAPGGVKLAAPAPAPDFQPPPRIDLIRRMGLPRALVERHVRMSDCERLDAPGIRDVPPVVAELSRTAILYGVPCIAAKPDVGFRVWIVETGEIGGVQPFFAALPDARGGWRGTDQLPNLRLETDGRIAAQETRRGGLVCPWQARWRWSDTSLALDEMVLAPGCGAAAAAKAPLRLFPPN